MKGYLDLWLNMIKWVVIGDEVVVIKFEVGDKCWWFKDWSENLVFDVIKQFYLFNQYFLMGLVYGVDGIDEKIKCKVEFLIKQMIDVLVLINFVLINLDVICEIMQLCGENLICGLKNLMVDLEKGCGCFVLIQIDMEGFKVGEDLVMIVGEVVFENDIIELIQYVFIMDMVKKCLFLIVLFWINKFYIFDLCEKNFMICWLIQQGFIVFLIFWVNLGLEFKDKMFEDYMYDGLLVVIDVVEEVIGEILVNMVGYCVGGIFFVSMLVYLEVMGQLECIVLVMFFVVQIDFELVGDLFIFIDEEWMKEIECLMDVQGGVLDG